MYFKIDNGYWTKHCVDNQIVLKKSLLINLFNDSINILRGYLLATIETHDKKPFILHAINSNIIDADVTLQFEDKDHPSS